jgi:TonB-dependent starch-binding outer membrane protein SusC
MFNLILNKCMKTKSKLVAVFFKNGIRKILLTMKISLFLIFASVLQVSGISIFSQNLTVSLDMQDATVREVIKEVEKQSNMSFFFNDELKELNTRISVSSKDRPVSEVLQKALSQANMTFEEIKENFVILLPIAADQKVQPYKISGQVTSMTSGDPMPGVSIVVEGTTVGTLSDNNGKFTIEVPGSDAVILMSFIGYASQKIPVKGLKEINVSLKEEVKTLDEVVVTGVGVSTNKRRLAISVEAVTSDKLPQASTASIDQVLVGKIAGAQISSVNGTPGAAANILLRGINSVNAGTLPMILMDGIQVSATNLNSLDLSTVERVEVVQGAASATIYGAQGANGVIQLFTKKGAKNGKINIDISSSVATSSYLNIGGVRKATLHGFNTDSQNNVLDGDGNPLVFSPVYGYKGNLIWLSTDPTTQTNKPYNANLTYYDHYKMFFQDAPTINNIITFSGGQDKLDIAFTLSNNHQESNLKNNGYLDRTNLTTNIGFELLKNLKFRSITQIVLTKNTMNGDAVIGEINMSRPFANYAFQDDDGNHIIYFGDAVGTIGGNALYDQQYRRIDDKKTDIIQSFDMNYKPFSFLELDAKYGINYQKQDNNLSFLDQRQNKSVQHYTFWLASQNFDDASGEFLKSIGTTTFQNILATANVHLDFQKDFNLKLPVISTTQFGYDFRKNDFNAFDVSGIGMPAYDPHTSADASSYRVLSDYTTLFATYGFLVTQRFDYGEYGGISAGVRSDYSSAFGAGSKPFTFPRGDAYIRISSFKFWRNSGLGRILPEFKIRSAYGEAGIQPGAYDRYLTLNPTQLAGKVVFTTPLTSTNPKLDVELSKEFEIGSDMTFNVLQGDWLKRLDFSVSYWKRSTDNSIWPLDVAPSTGLGGVLNNSFGLKSNGVQASLNLVVISNKDFAWNFTANFGKQSTEITSVKNGEAIPVSSSTGSAGYLLEPGYKIGQLYGYLALHDVNAKDPATGEPFIPTSDQGAYEVASNGWVVEKATKLPYFTTTKYSFGDPNPKFNMSFINDFSYKDFLNISMQWDWLNGSHLYNQTREWMYRDGIHKDLENEITINGETGAWSAFYRGCYAQVERNGTKSYFYEDASFLRLRNLVVAFDFARVFNIKSIRRLQLVLTGRNLITLTNYQGMDPEISSGTSNSSFDRGVDSHSMPNLKTYQAGINIGF